MKTLFPVHTRQNLALSLVLAISMIGISYGAGGVLPGDGLSESTAYLIEDLTDFDVFADQANAATYWASGIYTKLTCDPNLAGRTYTTAVIAPDTDSSSNGFQGILFAGVFDGDGHIISNLTIDTAGAGNDYLGLFGKISGSSAEVKNLGIENINITGGADSDYLGGLCGSNSGTITYCYATGSVAGNAYLGDLCGYNDGTITNCYATGSVTGAGSLGGLCGSNGGPIINCYATGSVTGDGSLGGLCGSNGGPITNCYATGSVTGGYNSRNLGGLCGTNGDWSNPGGPITNCYATGSVTGGYNSDLLGGLCGVNRDGSITNCFWDVETSGMTDGVGFGSSNGVSGKTTAEMQTQSTFTDGGWDFTNEMANGTNQIWQMPTGGGYPVLSNFNGYTPVPLSGDGTEASPYLINDAAELGAIYHYSSNACFRLQSDIDLTGIQWSTAIVPVCGGGFDGSGYVIYNLNIEGGGYLGLFGKISGSSAVVKNLGIENINIIGGDDTRYLGGLCGVNSGTITNCYATGSVIGVDYSKDIGGLCGSNSYGTIINCYATGSVTGGDHSSRLGGLCGSNSYGTIINCYATGAVTGGDVSYNLGGLCGYNFDTITNCFWDTQTSGTSVSYGGTGKTTAEMQTQSTFTDGGWDFTNEMANGTHQIWQMPTGGGYPVLSNFNGYTPVLLSGNGTEASPYLISDAAELGAIYHYNSNACFRLQSDVDLTGIQWSTAIVPVFSGCFDGNGYVIHNLNIEGGSYLGLFGKISGSSAQVKNLGIENINITGGDDSGCLGGLCGVNSGTITNCYAAGSVTGDDSLGGLCGENDGTITNCYATGSVTGGAGSWFLGGLCGRNYDGTITNCYATGSVTGDDRLGGLCGYNFEGAITNCYATGSVTGDDSLGGLCGYNYGTITNCYATGSVTGDLYLGGLCGLNSDTISNCFWDVETSGIGVEGDDNYGATGKTTEQMQTESTFTDAGWDFVGETANGTDDLWIMACYPVLMWQVSEYVNVPDIVNMTQAEAEAAITGLGLFVGTITFSYHDTVSAGVVISQNPQANVFVPISSCISFVVSLGIFEGITGSGTESDPYLINSLTDFQEFTNPDNAGTYWASGVYTKLTCDPNLAGRTYTTAVIAPDTPGLPEQFNGIPFAGIFDGNGHVVKNLIIDTGVVGNNYLGLFGKIEGSSAEVKNLGIENINITGDGFYSCDLGGLCGKNAGSISNCYATGSVTGAGISGGGLCGVNSGTITNCYATGPITGGAGSWFLGGLCGWNDYGTIANCYATGSVTGGWHSLGGLCGENDGPITNCYATGSVTGWDHSYDLGGLCGFNDSGTTTNCYATGSVTGGDFYSSTDGLCGYNQDGTITNSYATGLVTGGADSYLLGGLCELNDGGTISNYYFYLFSGPDNSFGVALDDLQMQDAASFVGFDFAGNPNDGQDDYWTIVNGHCPKLTWQTGDGPLPPTSPITTTLTGSGYSYDPFQINNCADFTEFRTNSGLNCGYYILTVDIDLSGETFTTAVINRYFGGHFDGNGHVIRNITIDTAGAGNDYLGLFSVISASVSDLGIENINITGGTYSDYLGGLCGYNYYGATITNCYATGSVTGSVTGWYNSDYLGGLCGDNDGTISNCYATGTVTGGAYSDSLGGLCGWNCGTITNCYATGLVTGGADSDYLGGLCGYNSGTITNCYATGSVTGGTYSDYLGGLCGYNEDGTITNCFWDVETSGMTDGVGNQDPDPAGVIGKTTEQMQTESTFTDAGWDFVGETANGTDDFWKIRDGFGYPLFVWQEYIPGDFTGSYGVDMVDFAVLADTWYLSSGQAGYNDLCDLMDDDTIDLNDLAVFAEHWLCN